MTVTDAIVSIIIVGTAINGVIFFATLFVAGFSIAFNLKMYTEYFKDRSISKRKEEER